MDRPGHKLVLSSPDAGSRVARAGRWLLERGRAREVLVVGATLQAAAELVRSVGKGAGGSFGWHRLTLAQLAWRLADVELTRKGKKPVSPLALEAVSARVVHAGHAAGTLGRFEAIADRPGLPRALSRTLAELRLAQVDPAALGDLDLAALARADARALADAGLADRADLFAAASAVARAGHALAGLPLVFLDVAVHTASELALVRALAGRAGDLLLTVPAGDERTRKNLESLGLPLEESQPGTATALARLQSSLFEDIGERDAPVSVPESVQVFSAPGESRECVEIARLIHRAAEEGIPFDRMAVLLRSPLQYRAHLEEAFRRAAIPVHFARGTVTPDPAGRAFLALLACASERLSAARFSEFLSLGEVPDATSTGAPPPPLAEELRFVPADDELALNIEQGDREIGRMSGSDSLISRSPDLPVQIADSEDAPVIGGTLRAPRLWERLLVDAAVIGGKDRWVRRLDGLEKDYDLKLAGLKDPEDPKAGRIRRDRSALDGLRQYALPLLEELASLPASALWAEWRSILGALATRAVRHPVRVLSVLQELAPMGDVGPVDLTEVRIVLERRLTEVVVPPSDRRFGKVFVAGAEEARGLAFDVVFVPGLAEKLFPQKIAEDPILPDRARRGTTMVQNQDRAAAERLALRLAVGAAIHRVVVSYPRLDLEQSRPRTPSFYGLEVLRAAEGLLPGFDELARRANVTGAARVGWPAPSRPADAIDHAEHDLALLEAVLRKPEAETVGTARYLLSSNVHLARALRFRAKRWLRKWTEADGLVAPAPQAQAALALHDLDARSYSPTGLQNFAACPYRFLLQAVHRLAPREEPQALEELDPLQRGSLIHEVLFELYSLLRERKLLPVTADNLEETRALLDVVLERVVARYEDNLAPAILRVWEDGVAAVRADLREWLRRATWDPTWKPVLFELAFGIDKDQNRDAKSGDLAAKLDCGIQLRGSIDLVEENEAGMLRATDYKTGKVRAHEGVVIAGGETLQPVLYALTLEKLQAGSTVVGGRLYYCTSVGEFTSVDVPLDDNARRAAKVLAETVHKSIRDGFLPAAPKKKACEYCDYQRVCGPYEEERTKRKRREELIPLETLRREP